MRRPTAPAARFKKTALAGALRIGLVEEIQNLLGAEAIEALDFEALETAVRDRSLQIAARALEQRFNRDTSDAVSGAQHPCACGQMARYVDRRSKCFQTVLGDLTLERASITALRAAVDSAPGTAPWAWMDRCPRVSSA